MRKIVIHCTTNTVGTDSWEFVEVPKDTSVREIDELAQEYANDNADMYGIYAPSEDDDDEAAAEADENIGGIWYDYVPEDHDRYTTHGAPNWESC